MYRLICFDAKIHRYTDSNRLLLKSICLQDCVYTWNHLATKAFNLNTSKWIKSLFEMMIWQTSSNKIDYRLATSERYKLYCRRWHYVIQHFAHSTPSTDFRNGRIKITTLSISLCPSSSLFWTAYIGTNTGKFKVDFQNKSNSAFVSSSV